MEIDEKVQVESAEKNTHHLSQLASVGQIAAGIAHEVRNPLTAVKGFLQLLEENGKNEYIEIAQSELDNALITLNNLLQVSKPDLEDEEFQSFNLTVELESILNLFQDKLYNINVKTDFKNTDMVVTGKKNQFKKAFFNLIKNAIESIEGIGELSLTHFLEDNDVIVTIEDTGVGIPEEKLTLLGTPFFSTKDHGTGMGLTQVFSVIYQHGGKITVDSVVGKGTKFTIRIPRLVNLVNNKGVKKLNLTFSESATLKDYFIDNQKDFEAKLLDEAINVRDKIEEIHQIGNINLLSNANKLVMYLIEEREHELTSFAKYEGIAWAKHSLTLAFKLEWVQAIRRTVWLFLYNYEVDSGSNSVIEDFYNTEKKVNELVDKFLTTFFISYTKYKDELLEEQRQLVENLSVPIIPINRSICILPLIGFIDYLRIGTIQEKVLVEIENQRIQTLIMDLSGVPPMDHNIMQRLLSIIDGIAMMGCKTILTGLRAEIVTQMVSKGDGFYGRAEFKGTLQVALNDVLFKEETENVTI
ncbi:STAS domain-containing protein [Bacillus sp. BGMRC 2118]|nr:STAS domain-containing protein [Bacillus sp. BGMRC 2118]